MSSKSKGGPRPGAGRPKGSPNKITRPIKELAADYSEECIHRLVHLSQHAESEQVRLAANIAVLDRAHGRPRQEIDLTRDNAITVIVNRQGRYTTSEGLPVEHQRPALEDHSMDDGEEERC
jgi:hypothetical protein